MIDFKDITPGDKELIQSFTLKSTRRNCDLSFANLCSWRFMYHTKFAVVDGFLVLRFFANEELAYMTPVGEGDLAKVLHDLIEDAREVGQPFRMLGMCIGMIADVKAVMPDKFSYTVDRDYADYIYLRTDLATLAGKKYQAKRNHVNKFRKTYPNHEYKAITPELIPECLALEATWCKANNCHEEEALQNERKSLTYDLTHFEELGLTGGVLHVDGKIVAFTFGMPINNHTFDVCVEKANTNIDGAYTMINYEFANHISPEYTYINREEDLGIEGLRKAKLSYQPDILLEKGIGTILL